MNFFSSAAMSENNIVHEKSKGLNLSIKYRRILWLVLLSVLAVRLLTLGMYSLQDTTEARYGEIARIMVETQNWVTPQFDYDVPFWGKPPLATWLSAGSFEILGVNEFAARLPSFFIALMVLILVYHLATRQRNSDLGLLSTFMLSSSVLFFIIAGAIIMDAALLLGVTLSMVAFWRAMNSIERRYQYYWGYAFFIGISIGLLSKGPLVFVLTGVPIGLWVILQGSIKQTWKKIPWISGIVLMLIISLPWYILAEQRTPGFIDYFIIGEHWNRFMISGWQGDLYGTAHAKPRGTIWLHAIMSFFPWSFLLPIILWRLKSIVKQQVIQNHSWAIYLSLWAITPLLFFTFSGNILATYTLPAMVPLAIITAELLLILLQTESVKKYLKIFVTLGIVMPLIMMTAIAAQNEGYIKTKSQKDIIARYDQLKTDQQSQLIYLLKRPFSAQFYSKGQAIEIKSWQQILPYLEDEKSDYYVIKNNQLQKLPNDVLFKLRLIGEYHGYSLLQESDKGNIGLNE